MFSAKNRNVLLAQLNKGEYDVVIIGGGITGAGIALDASARGLKVALIEMQDFASGTSGRSTKLIHGGLRYLKQLELKLVAEVGKERAIVQHNAPHLTRPEAMILPIVKNGSLNKFTARIAMWVYEFIASVKKEEWHKVLSKEQTILAEPLLKKEGLLGGILFYEYRTDDARLTIEVLKEAVSLGATAINYIKATSFVYSNNKIKGVKCHDKINDREFTITAKYLINAGGPWVDAIDDLDEKQMKHKLHVTKGVHLVVDHKKLPVKQSAYFDTYDKRMMFVIPRDGKTYMGTTDTFYSGDLTAPDVLKEDRDYILKCVNEFFPAVKLTASDVESGWAGLRPLVNKPGKGPSEISRKDEIFETPSGLIIIAGGKLTGYRKMAQRIVDLISTKMKPLGKHVQECTTHHISLSGGKLPSHVTFKDFAKTKIAEGSDYGLTAKEAEVLLYRFGTNIDILYSIINSTKSTYNSQLPLVVYAQLMYCVEYELCMTPSDFFIRRTGFLYFDISTMKQWSEAVVTHMQKTLGWSEELKTLYEKELGTALEEAERIKI
ncbi:MAG: FAD-dependent oxidoreductase [Bacteroidetes bacterium]|nr:FAD-dependent oxidoreductase [Bacteroidota bacterium]